jgi:hypothetical protein
MNAAIAHLPVLLIVVPILGALLILLAGKVKGAFAYPITLSTIAFQFAASLILLR